MKYKWGELTAKSFPPLTSSISLTSPFPYGLNKALKQLPLILMFNFQALLCDALLINPSFLEHSSSFILVKSLN